MLGRRGMDGTYRAKLLKLSRIITFRAFSLGRFCGFPTTDPFMRWVLVKPSAGRKVVEEFARKLASFFSARISKKRWTGSVLEYAPSGPRLWVDEEFKFCPHHRRFSRTGSSLRACACSTQAECDSRSQIERQAGKPGKRAEAIPVSPRRGAGM